MNRIEIVFGTERTKEGVTIPSHIYQVAILNIQRRAAQMFGGFTLTSGRGGWVNGESYVNESSATIVIFYAKDDDLDPMLQELVHTIKTELQQESVLAFKSKVQPV